jgi:uncharacterized protein (DUF2141 family)
MPAPITRRASFPRRRTALAAALLSLVASLASQRAVAADLIQTYRDAAANDAQFA